MIVLYSTFFNEINSYCKITIIIILKICISTNDGDLLLFGSKLYFSSFEFYTYINLTNSHSFNPNYLSIELKDSYHSRSVEKKGFLAKSVDDVNKSSKI